MSQEVDTKQSSEFHPWIGQPLADSDEKEAQEIEDDKQNQQNRLAGSRVVGIDSLGYHRLIQ